MKDFGTSLLEHLREPAVRILAALWTLAGLIWAFLHEAVPTPDGKTAYPPVLEWLPRSEYLPLWVALSGALLFLLTLPVTRRTLPWAGLVLALVCVMVSTHVLARNGKRAEVYGQEVSWLDDDMMISLRYARNLAEGNGLVWNPGERVEGVTNFLWTLCMVPAHWMVPVESVSFLIILFNTALLLVLIVLLFRWVRALGGGDLAASLAALAVATSAGALSWTVGGGESTLLGLLLLLMADRAVRDRTDRRDACLLGLLGGLAFLTRPDALVALAVLAACAAWRRRRSMPWCLSMAGSLAALPVLQLLFRRLYYGDWLPNTYYLKATGWDGRTAAGLEYVLGLLPHYGLWLAGAALAVVACRKLLVPLLAVLAHLAYLVWVGGDELPEQRFVVPVLPLLVAGAFIGATWLGARLGGGLGGLSAALPVLFLAVAGMFGGVVPGTFPAKLLSRSDAEARNVHLGYLLLENTEPDARIAHFWAGATAYFSDRPAIDLFGKCDPVIARQDAHEGLDAPGHNKYDFDHSLGLEPDVIVQLFPGLMLRLDGFRSPQEAAQARAFQEDRRNSDYRAGIDLLEHPAFQAQYLPRMVGAFQGTPKDVGMYSLRWHGVYVRMDTTRARPAWEWQVPEAP